MRQARLCHMIRPILKILAAIVVVFAAVSLPAQDWAKAALEKSSRHREYVPIKLDTMYNESEFKQSYYEYCDDNHYESSYRDKTKTFVSKHNPELLEKIKLCLAQKGLHFWVEQASDPTRSTAWNPAPT